MTNKLNIGDKVKIIMPNTAADGQIVTVTRIELLVDTIYYTGLYHPTNCSKDYDMSVQFTEGQYEQVEGNTCTAINGTAYIVRCVNGTLDIQKIT